jgi:acylphosphatase
MSDAAFLVHVVIRGQVQGIGFRAWVADEARAARLNGYVRNRRDGTVEAVFAGDEDTVEAMLRACRQGPSGAKVEGIETGKSDVRTIPRPGSGRFEVLGTQ